MADLTKPREIVQFEALVEDMKKLLCDQTLTPMQRINFAIELQLATSVATHTIWGVALMGNSLTQVAPNQLARKH